MVSVVPIEIGWRAHAALARGGGRAERLAALSTSMYLRAGGELICLGRPGAPLHGRAALVPAIPADAEELTIDASHARRWRPPALGAVPVPRIAAGCRTLLDLISALGRPTGLGVLLVGRRPGFLLADTADAAAALAEACATDDPSAALAAAGTLIGAGPGLTPAGDDYVGGAFFARKILGPGATRDADAWEDVAASVRALAAERTHPISAALLSDLTGGEGYAPLHDLASALACRPSEATIVASACRLTLMGHSSGWDLLAGFVGGILGSEGRAENRVRNRPGHVPALRRRRWWPLA